MVKKILVIDDEELIIKSLVKLLERNGFKAFIAKTGQDALIMVDGEEFDLIISDIRMPGVTGVEVVKGIFRELEMQGKSRPPVIFITRYADKGCEEAASLLNPIDYIYKPFDITDLMARIKGVFSS